MSLWLAIAARSPEESKSRLASVLDKGSRAYLSMALYKHVLSVAIDAVTARRVAVISASPIFLGLALDHNAHSVPEVGTGQNQALAQVAAYCRQAGATTLLTLSSDLPFLHLEDLRILIREGHGCDVVVGADRHDSGTNAILQSPPGLIRFSHGPNSLARHVASARGVGASVGVIQVRGIACDVDTPEDLAQFCTASAIVRAAVSQSRGAPAEADRFLP